MKLLVFEEAYFKKLSLGLKFISRNFQILSFAKVHPVTNLNL